MALVLSKLQAANHLDRISICGIEKIRVEHLPRPQDLDVDQIEIRPVILVGDGGIDGTKDGIFAGAHNWDGSGGIMAVRFKVGEVVKRDFETSSTQNVKNVKAGLESHGINS